MSPPGAVISGFSSREGRGPQEEKSLMVTVPLSSEDTVRVLFSCSAMATPLAWLMLTVGIR